MAEMNKQERTNQMMALHKTVRVPEYDSPFKVGSLLEIKNEAGPSYRTALTRAVL